MSYLNFKLLDDLFMLPEGEREASLLKVQFYRIGPVIEAIRTYSITDLPEWVKNTNSQFVKDLLSVLLSKSSDEFINAPLIPPSWEFAQSPNGEENDSLKWNAFCRRLEGAAVSSGLTKTFASQITGAFLEMVSNLEEHCERAETGLVGYRWVSKEFEFVVSDSGVGLLQSLTTNTEYASISDEGEALEVALTHGESRFGRRQGRGNGFDILTSKIAQNKSFLRFCSGDCCLSIDGTKPNTPKVISQLGFSKPGFHISVVCKSE